MTNVIEYPVKTSEWGKTLIDTLNPIIDRLEQLIEGVNKNVNLQFATFREDVNKRIEKTSIVQHPLHLLSLNKMK